MRKSAVLLSTLALLAFGAGAAAWKLKPVWDEVVSNTADLADAHLRHATAHPGWSFPSRVYSAAAPVASARLSDLQAIGRGYEVQCPPEALRAKRIALNEEFGVTTKKTASCPSPLTGPPERKRCEKS